MNASQRKYSGRTKTSMSRLIQRVRLKTLLANALSKRGVLFAINLHMMYAEMSNLKKIPQVSSAEQKKYHTDIKNWQNRGGKNSIHLKNNIRQTSQKYM